MIKAIKIRFIVSFLIEGWQWPKGNRPYRTQMKACAFIAFLAVPIDIINVCAIDLATSADTIQLKNTIVVVHYLDQGKDTPDKCFFGCLFVVHGWARKSL